MRVGRVSSFATHVGTVSSAVWSPPRYEVGVCPTSSVKRALNEPSDVQPTAVQTSVTDMYEARATWATSRGDA